MYFLSEYCNLKVCRPALKLLARGDQPLLMEISDLDLVLDLGRDIVNGVGCLDVQGDGLALDTAPISAHAMVGADLAGGRVHQRWSVSSFWML